jgi:hypothetical protein
MQKLTMKSPALFTALFLVTLAIVASAAATSNKNSVAPARTNPVQSAPVFSSRYTALTKCVSGLTKKEEREAEQHGSDIPTRCKGPGGYDINISYSACTSEFSVDKGEESIPFATQSVAWKQKTVEWRLANGKPFAIIMRAYEYAANEYCAIGDKITGEFLIVKGLKGYEQIDEKVSVKGTPNPNAKARAIADKAYAQPKS